jgi:hypothetical protein
LPEIVQEIGSYAGLAAVVGLAILSVLYFSQARDVKRLREWAGRAPERMAEIEAGGRAAAAVPVAARPQPQVRPVEPAAQEAAGTATAGAGAQAAAASTGAAPATATQPATAAQPATAGAAAGNGTEEGAEEAAEKAEEAAAASGDADEEEAVAPAAATPAGAVASGAGTAERTGTAVAGDAGTATPAPSDTGTGAKVLPARRPAPPVRPRPTIPPRPIPPRPAPTSVLGQAPGSRPPARGGRNWPAPRYIALIVAGVVILGLGGTVGVLQLTKEDAGEEPTTVELDTNVGDPTAQPDQPEPARVNPADVTVTVLNATNTTGLAVRILSRLEQAGFQKGNTGNAIERQRAESVVMYKPGKKEDARAVARRLDIGSTEPIDEQASQLAGVATVVVVLGADKANQ